jgi:hypothetical protein
MDDNNDMFSYLDWLISVCKHITHWGS